MFHIFDRYKINKSKKMSVSSVKEFVTNGGKFEELKPKAEENGLLVRELKAYEYSKSLYLLASKEAVGVSKLHDSANGAIFEKDSNSLVAECVNLLYEDLEPEELNTLLKEGCETEKVMNDEGQDIYSDNPVNYHIEFAEDGTMIRLYNFKGEWHTATTKCIDARNSYWLTDNYSFNEMFYDGLQAPDLPNQLNPDYTYCFILKHPLNRLVMKHNTAELVFVSKINNSTGKETLVLDQEHQGEAELYKQVKQTVILPCTIEDTYTVTENWADSMEYEETRTVTVETSTQTNTNWTKQELDNMIARAEASGFKGILLVKHNGDTGKYTRIMYETKWYKEIKDVKGNTPNVEKRWLELYREDDIEKSKRFVSVYPEYYQKFRDLEELLKSTVNELYKTYLQTHVFKDYRIDESNKYFKSVKRLHGIYMRSKSEERPKGEPITYDKTLDLFKSFEVHVMTKLMGLEQRPNKERRRIVKRKP